MILIGYWGCKYAPDYSFNAYLDCSWRRMRRSSEFALGLKISNQYHPFQSDEAVLLAYDYNPQNNGAIIS
jgi:hypothetical protein